MADVSQQQVVEYIKGISVLELSQLVKALESELGVSAAAAMPMAMPMGGGGAAAAPFSGHPIRGSSSAMPRSSGPAGMRTTTRHSRLFVTVSS